jgi:hypothetical protein
MCAGKDALLRVGPFISSASVAGGKLPEGAVPEETSADGLEITLEAAEFRWHETLASRRAQTPEKSGGR